MSSFNDYNLPPQLIEALAKINYKSPTPIQEQAIPLAMNGADLIASAQTGTGKTAAFGVPMIANLMANPKARALILAPTRELAGQILAVIRELTVVAKHIDAVLIIGGSNMMRQKNALQKNPRVIVATPGRLVDHLRTKKSVLNGISFLVLDEADRMLDMGFAPQLKEIRLKVNQDRQTLLFSATYPQNIANLSKEWLRDPKRIRVGAVNTPIAKITQEVMNVNGDQKPVRVVDELKKRDGSVLIFTRTKRRADRLTNYLKDKGFSTCRIHSDRTQGQRQQALAGFREGEYRILVATDIAARGLDVPHIEHVINFDLPLVADDYIHRIGRTGRAGKSGRALCLVSPEEKGLWRSIERLKASRSH